MSTARHWLHSEGFHYICHRKGLYFDGHDRPDVVAYRQDIFLPMMKRLECRLVQYIVGQVETEQFIEPQNYVEHRLVLCCHDEMTCQANDAQEKGWVLDNQFPLQKKGAGHGLHQSDIICSTVGWLKEESDNRVRQEL
jgi:hypothetical protein